MVHPTRVHQEATYHMTPIVMLIGNQIGEVMNEMKPITTPTGTASKEGTNPTNPRIPRARF